MLEIFFSLCDSSIATSVIPKVHAYLNSIWGKYFRRHLFFFLSVFSLFVHWLDFICQQQHFETAGSLVTFVECVALTWSLVAGCKCWRLLLKHGLGKGLALSVEMCYIAIVIYQDLYLKCMGNISDVTICLAPVCWAESPNTYVQYCVWFIMHEYPQMWIRTSWFCL